MSKTYVMGAHGEIHECDGYFAENPKAVMKPDGIRKNCKGCDCDCDKKGGQGKGILGRLFGGR
jgi:hypothetical protein